MDIIEKEIDKLKGLKGFHFVTKEGSSSVDIDNEQEVVDNGSNRCPPRTGEHCTMISKSTSTILMMIGTLTDCCRIYGYSGLPYASVVSREQQSTYPRDFEEIRNVLIDGPNKE